MQNQNKILSNVVLSLILFLTPSLTLSQKTQPDNFNKFIQELVIQMPGTNSDIYSVPTESDLVEWNKVLSLFRSHSLDSCKYFLGRYNYELLSMKDASTGDIYDIIKEKNPVRKGWGTFIYNRNHKKRLYIHINHPLDDAHALIIGTEIFRSLKGEWLLIAGTSRRSILGKLTADVGRVKKSIFERTHEMLSDLTHVTLSLHSYDENSFPYPISATDAIISNGKTSDEQWGISQISLAFRDSLRAAGFNCGLAMYDSGYARLSGGWNYQGIFSNDSAGFGHWIYLELSKKIRERPSEYHKLITAIDRALELTGKKISHQVNRAFGLVSPRVIRVDSLHKLFFPPENAEAYRIISFNASDKKNDTIDIRIRNWIELLGSKKNGSTVTVLDTSNRDFTKEYRRTNRTSAPEVVSKIMKPSNSISSMAKFKDEDIDSSLTDDSEHDSKEPLQVHRIPLKPILQQTYYNELSTGGTPFHWAGIVPAGFKPDFHMFDVNNPSIATDDLEGLPKFIIPIISSSYRTGKDRFLGVQMTDLLVNEIARLITEYQVADEDIGIIAEQSDQGEYYLRLFPNVSTDNKGNNIVERNR